MGLGDISGIDDNEEPSSSSSITSTDNSFESDPLSDEAVERRKMSVDTIGDNFEEKLCEALTVKGKKVRAYRVYRYPSEKIRIENGEVVNKEDETIVSIEGEQVEMKQKELSATFGSLRATRTFTVVKVYDRPQIED